MKFGILNEGQVAKGSTHAVRIQEVIDEAVHADKLGFDYWGTSEQHLVPSAWTVSSPQAVYGAVAALTKRIKLRTMAVVALKELGHPILTAERLATLDAISQGRVEFGSARSNNSAYQTAFGIDPTKTRQEWLETVEATLRAMQENPFTFKGEIYNIDEPFTVSPRPYSLVPPPVWASATSVESHKMTGELGIGVMTLENWFGWDYAKDCVEAHIEGFKSAAPIGGLYPANPGRAFLAFPAHVAETHDRAVDEARETALGLVASVTDLYMNLAKSEKEKGGDSYAYLLETAEKLEPFTHDVEALIEHSPSAMIGTPDEVIERIQRLEKMGYNEIILKIDNHGHRTNLRSMEMFAKYVIPAVKHPSLIPENDYELRGVEAKSYLI
ncbi:LLM class flavin-dependent oxidoreductase [Pseudarthrobacter sp. H3Y2-7]|uniref:LLM class flavin-dependent oxidoreductase n=1 Tax=Pseudarthrobacter naphthalenicus TaxID=3031328 RepID=UPI0023B03A53|nr:LLM class flavin-dependent oxidoreductase [Pseudarthrobacter sp. H3Y2-7]MDE8671098.1 LLM class flavin-dependent oxidoreductase [Pseudarthrobacter sp. H3Y2-7]